MEVNSGWGGHHCRNRWPAGRGGKEATGPGHDHADQFRIQISHGPLHHQSGPGGRQEAEANSVFVAGMSFEAYVFLMLTDEQPGVEQIKALRAMSGQERLGVAERLYWAARKMKAAGLRAQHPDWPEVQVEASVRRIFSDARS